ncbi:MAG: hypothetical protein FWG80_02515 [Alphaproteobacteria bacterium]|nr:hypothetical protein [Alphaproteobacteria bacterium]
MRNLYDKNGNFDPCGGALVRTVRDLRGIEILEDGIIRIHSKIAGLQELGGLLSKQTSDKGGKIAGDIYSEKTLAFRTNIHFTLNHKVASHMAGNWKDAKYTIIGNMHEVIQRNGCPLMINPVDTYWNVGTGALDIPDAVLVTAKSLSKNSEPLKVDSKSHITIKSENFKVSDFDDAKAIVDIIATGINAVTDNALYWEQAARMVPETYAMSYEVLSAREFLDIFEKPHEFFEDKQNFSATELSRIIIDMFIRVLGDKRDAKYDRALEQIVLDATESEMNAKGMDMAINKVLHHLGYHTVTGGSHYSHDSKFQGAVDKYANEIGVMTGIHANDPTDMSDLIVKMDFSKPLPQLLQQLPDSVDKSFIWSPGTVRILRNIWPEIKSKYVDEIKKIKKLYDQIYSGKLRRAMDMINKQNNTYTVLQTVSNEYE